MTELITLNSVEQAAQLYTGKSAEHPLLHVFDLADTHTSENYLNTRICNNLYCVSLKNNFCTKVKYGRQHYDFSSGVLTAYGPGQVIEVEDVYQLGELQGWVVMFHPDLLLRHTLAKDIKKLGYFSYDVFEALHVSEREQVSLLKLVQDIGNEAKQNQDEFSLDIMRSSLDLLLKYIDRYFNRQFLTRKPFTYDHVEHFLELVDNHLSQAEAMEAGLPMVADLAEQLNMSPNYLSDLLRSQTGKSAQELIHQQLIEKAKYLLLNSTESVSSIAYKLGFEYPQYFSRIFKKKTSLTPGEYRNHH